jgi:hypothetical protein
MGMICYQCYAEEHDRCEAKHPMNMTNDSTWAMRCDCATCNKKEKPDGVE